jgi:Putative type VII ESX secretion system translocon, EccE
MSEVAQMNERPETTYRFGPLERMGFMLGLRVPQLAGLVVALALALACLNSGGLTGLALAISVAAAGAGVFLKAVRGHTLEEWAPLTVRFLVGRWSGRARFRAQLAQVGHVVRVPEGGLEPERPGEPKALPSELATLEFLEGELAHYGGTPFGVIVDRRAKTMTAVLRCQGASFALLGAEDRELRLAQYGGMLAALARDGSPVRRIAWTERTLPANHDQLAQYVIDHKREDLDLDAPTDELVSYLQLLRRAPDVAEDHVLLFSVQIDIHRAAARQVIRRQGGGDLGGMAVLADELGRVIELLEAAGMAVTGALTRRGVASAVRNAYDPWGCQQRERMSPHGLSPVTAGPMARDERWSHIQTDGALHTTLWISEWPRIDVRATFLQPLLTSSRATRTVTMVMELVGPSKAIARVERAVTENATNESMRLRIGQRTTKRTEKQEQATARREEELASGHAEVRFAGFITVSTPTVPGGVDELESTVARVELEAKHAMLRLERLWGQQAEAFTYGALPLCRGLR